MSFIFHQLVRFLHTSTRSARKEAATCDMDQHGVHSGEEGPHHQGITDVLPGRTNAFPSQHGCLTVGHIYCTHWGAYNDMLRTTSLYDAYILRKQRISVLYDHNVHIFEHTKPIQTLVTRNNVPHPKTTTSSHQTWHAQTQPLPPVPTRHLPDFLYSSDSYPQT